MRSPSEARLISWGGLAWAVSIWGEGVGAQPYSTVGLIISTATVAAGLALWTVRHWSVLMKMQPTFSKEQSRENFSLGYAEEGFDFLKRVVLIIWTLTLTMAILIVAMMNTTTRKSPSFLAARRFCEADAAVKKIVGDVWYYGVLFGQEKVRTADHRVRLSFTIVGTKRNADAVCEVERNGEVWAVQSCHLD